MTGLDMTCLQRRASLAVDGRLGRRAHDAALLGDGVGVQSPKWRTAVRVTHGCNT
jgi:hypothetical protein